MDERLLKFAKAMRSGQTDAESALWRELRGGRLLEYKFKRQQPIGKLHRRFRLLRMPADHRNRWWSACRRRRGGQCSNRLAAAAGIHGPAVLERRGAAAPRRRTGIHHSRVARTPLSPTPLPQGERGLRASPIARRSIIRALLERLFPQSLSDRRRGALIEILSQWHAPSFSLDGRLVAISHG